MNTDGTAAGNNLLQDRKAAEPRAIIVVSIGDQHQSIYSQTRRSIEQYARRIGAALLNVDSVGVLPTDLVQIVCTRSYASEREPLPYVAKCWAIYDALGSFERVALLDSSCVVQNQCADLFELVSPGSVGGWNESTMTDFKSWKIDTRLAKEKRALDLSVYLNTGVLVVSRCHRELFSPGKIIGNLDLFHGPYADQLFINIMLAQSHTPVCELSRAYNYVPVFNYADESHRKLTLLDATHLEIICREGNIVHVTGYFEQRESILAQVIRGLLKAGHA
jgi:hypothetical protein